MTATWWAPVALVVLGIVLTFSATALVHWRVPSTIGAGRATALSDLPAGVLTRGRALHARRAAPQSVRFSAARSCPDARAPPAGPPSSSGWAKPFGGHWLAEVPVADLTIVMMLWLVSQPFRALLHLRDDDPDRSARASSVLRFGSSSPARERSTSTAVMEISLLAAHRIDRGLYGASRRETGG